MNIKKTKIMTTEEIQNFDIDNEHTEIVKEFASLGLVINAMETAAKKSREGWDSEESDGRIRTDHQDEKNVPS